MSALDSAPLSEEEALPFTRPEFVERRVWRNLFAVIIVAVAISALAADFRFTLGLALGSALALLNYRWLGTSLRGVLAAGAEKTPPGTMLKFVVRWIVVAAAGWSANKTGYFEAVGILAGLFAPALAVMIEAAYVVCKTISSGTRDGF
jgi:ABC-type phosphate/phosphonate transport system permease subunit